MPHARLGLTRSQILAYRRRVGALDVRLRPGADSLRQVAWAGLQDSMPRAALLSIHARVADTPPTVLDDPALVQVWGPRYSVFVVAAEDVPWFTVARMPDRADHVDRAVGLATRIRDVVGDGEMPMRDVAATLGEDSNRLRYATTTGTILIRWDGARQPTVRVASPPDVSPEEARRELARRYVRVFGPVTQASFEKWAGIRSPHARAAFDAIAGDLLPVRTPIGDAWVLEAAEEEFGTDVAPAPARLLPSGDTFFLYWGADRALLVPEAPHRDLLWTSRVWPGALVVGGEIVGMWRRSQHKVTIQSWRRLTVAERAAVEQEATALPLPGLERELAVTWDV